MGKYKHFMKPELSGYCVPKITDIGSGSEKTAKFLW